MLCGKGREVPVVLWEINDKHEKSLDRYEGYPVYYIKENLVVQTEHHGEVEAMVYIMADGYNLEKPTNSYLETCTEGYDNFNFDKRFLNDALKSCI